MAPVEEFGNVPVLTGEGFDAAKAQNRAILAQARSMEEQANLAVAQQRAQLEQVEFARKNTLTKGETIRFEALKMAHEIVGSGVITPDQVITYAANLATFVTSPDTKPRPIAG